MIAVKTCGKLYWAGEYAILEPGQLALIKAIPIYMKAEIAFSDSYRIYSDLFDFAVDLTPNPDYSLIQETIALMGDFLAVVRLCDLFPWKSVEKWNGKAKSLV